MILEAEDRRGGGAHGPPRALQGSILGVLDTEEISDLPRLGNRPQDSITDHPHQNKDTFTLKAWDPTLGRSVLLQALNAHTRYRESKQQQQKQPNKQRKWKKDALQIVRCSLDRLPGGGPRGGGRIHLPPLAQKIAAIFSPASDNRNRRKIATLGALRPCRKLTQKPGLKPSSLG